MYMLHTHIQYIHNYKYGVHVYYEASPAPFGGHAARPHPQQLY